MRVGQAMSADGLPVQATSLPSNFEVYPVCTAFPWGSVPTDVSLIPSAVASNFRVSARIAASEPKCDFAAFSFQLPTQFSLAVAGCAHIDVAAQSNRDDRI